MIFMILTTKIRCQNIAKKMIWNVYGIFDNIKPNPSSITIAFKLIYYKAIYYKYRNPKYFLTFIFTWYYLNF